MTVFRVDVRTLAETLYRRGDLHFAYDAAVLPSEGIAAHRELAQHTAADAEVTVRARFVCGDDSLDVRGRIDAVELTQRTLVVHEFKATRSEVERVHAHWREVHFGQAALYAALWLRQAPAETVVDTVTLTLHYLHVDSRAQRRFTRQCATADLQAQLAAAAAAWLAKVRRRAQHRARRDAALATMAFPLGSFRPYQRALAAAAFRAHRDSQALVCEAPTGLGKTWAFVFPALKAMAAGHSARVLYLTARGTAQDGVLDSLRAVADRSASPLRVVQLTAKDKVCFTPGAPCTGEACVYARGYYDKLPNALADLAAQGIADRAAVVATARAHVVCPFDLALAVAPDADLVVCDANYVLDPFVRSARVIGAAAKQTAVLIDEVHRLPERAREMHSITVPVAVFGAAASHAPRGVRTLLRTLAKRIARLARDAATAGPANSGSDEWLIVDAAASPREDDGRVTVLAQLDQDLAELERKALPLLATAPDETLRQAFFAASGWRAARAFAQHAPYALLAAGDATTARLSYVCLDASPLVRQCLAGFRTVQGFSATLPGGARLPPLGFPDAVVEWQVPPVFPAEHLGLFALALDVSLRGRAQSVSAVAAAIAVTAAGRPGNYLVFAPSFDYLGQLADAVALAAPQAVCLRQIRAADDAARGDLLAALVDDGVTRILFAATGGVFAEAIDLGGGRVRGVVVVGVGLAPPNRRDELLREHLAAAAPEIALAATYDVPAMIRVRQAVGRLLRAPEDRGVALLIDRRFAQPRFAQWLPAQWRPQWCHATTLADAIAAFWAGGEPADPRDAAPAP